MSTSERNRLTLDRRDLLIGAVVSFAAFVIYRLTMDASLAGLFAPDGGLPRFISEGRVVEYIARTKSGMPWRWASVIASATIGVTYWNARRLGATRATSAGAALALAFGRDFWSQALLPGIQHVFGVCAAAAIACSVRWDHIGRQSLLATGILLLAAAGPTHIDRNVAVVDVARWMFLELNAAVLALAVTGTASLFRANRRIAATVVTTVAGLLLTIPFRGAPSEYAALIPVYVAIAPLVAAGATRLIAWLGSPRFASAMLVLLPLVPLAGNVRHVAAGTDAIVRPYLERLADRARGCPAVIGHVNLTQSLDERVVDAATRDACEVLVLPEARSSLEHLGYRFKTVPMSGDDRPNTNAFDAAVVQFSRLESKLPCVTLRTAEWTDVGNLAGQGRVGVRLGSAPGGGVVLYAGRERALDPWGVRSWGVLAPRVDSVPVSGTESGVPDAVRSATSIRRVDISGGGGASSLTSLDFSGIPKVVIARSLVDDPSTEICPAPRGNGLFDDLEVRREVVSGRRSSFGDGWGPMERVEGGSSRVLQRSEGELLIGLARTLPLEVVVRASHDRHGIIALRINGVMLAMRPLVEPPNEYRWVTPASIWRTGVNQVFVVSQPGIRIGEIAVVQIRP
jgi:hypothetical protein